MPTTSERLEEVLYSLAQHRAETGAPVFDGVDFGRSQLGRPLEPAGAEALLTLAQQALGPALADVLRRVNVVLIPRLNPDGAESALRANAVDIDLDTDLALRSNEAWGFAGLVRALDPELVVELRACAGIAPGCNSRGDECRTGRVR